MRRVSLRLFLVVALAVAVGLAVGASPFASSSPDGLQRVAEDKGFVDDGRLHPLQDDSAAPGYAFPGIGNPRLATALAGFTGTLLVALAGFGVAYAVRRRRALSEA